MMKSILVALIVLVSAITSFGAFPDVVVRDVVRVKIEYLSVRGGGYANVLVFREDPGNHLIRVSRYTSNSEESIVYVKDVKAGEMMWIEVWSENNPYIKIHIRDNNDIN